MIYFSYKSKWIKSYKKILKVISVLKEAKKNNNFLSEYIRLPCLTVVTMRKSIIIKEIHAAIRHRVLLFPSLTEYVCDGGLSSFIILNFYNWFTDQIKSNFKLSKQFAGCTVFCRLGGHSGGWTFIPPADLQNCAEWPLRRLICYFAGWSTTFRRLDDYFAGWSTIPEENSAGWTTISPAERPTNYDPDPPLIHSCANTAECFGAH